MNLFGTDGIRGKYGEELTKETAYALGSVLAQEQNQAIVVIGRDTRTSGSELLSALSKGVYDYGGQVLNMGIVPTNAVAHYVLKTGADFGVMISASHNPPDYNGLKVFDKYGVKICASKQHEFSQKILQTNVVLSCRDTYVSLFEGSEESYIQYIKSNIQTDLRGLKIAVDCCYGSAYKVGKEIFAQYGADVVAYCNFDKGELINVDCGATVPSFLKRQMLSNGCQLGFAFDGDADRVAVFEGETLLSPDNIFFAYAKYFYQLGQLNKNTVVGTIMTDTGLEKSLKKLGVNMIRTDVGDSNIYDKMIKEGFVLGGENSGHYLLSNYATGSDALINALLIAKIFKEKGSLLAFTAEYKPYYNASKNILVEKSVFNTIRDNDSLCQTRRQFAEKYPTLRLVARLSGTEPKIRIYVEGKNKSTVESGMTFVVGLITTLIELNT